MEICNVTPPIASGSAFFGAGSPSCTWVLWRFVTCIAKVTGNFWESSWHLRPRPCVWPNLSIHTSHDAACLSVASVCLAYTNLPLLGIVDGVVFPLRQLAVQPPKPSWHHPPQSCLPEDPHGAQIGRKIHRPRLEWPWCNKGYQLPWSAKKMWNHWAQSWKAKAQSEPFTFKANNWSRHEVDRCSFLSLPLGSQLKTKFWFTTNLCKVLWSQNDAEDASGDIIDWPPLS